MTPDALADALLSMGPDARAYIRSSRTSYVRATDPRGAVLDAWHIGAPGQCSCILRREVPAVPLAEAVARLLPRYATGEGA